MNQLTRKALKQAQELSSQAQSMNYWHNLPPKFVAVLDKPENTLIKKEIIDHLDKARVSLKEAGEWIDSVLNSDNQ